MSQLVYVSEHYTYYERCVVLAAHGLVQGCNAILCSEVQMCPSTFQHFDELCTSFQLCCLC